MPEKVHTLEFFLFSSADWYSHNWQENENITSNIIFQPMHTECKPPLSQIELHIEPNNLPRSAWALQSVLADGLPLLLAKQHRVLPGEFLGLGVELDLPREAPPSPFPSSLEDILCEFNWVRDISWLQSWTPQYALLHLGKGLSLVDVQPGIIPDDTVDVFDAFCIGESHQDWLKKFSGLVMETLFAKLEDHSHDRRNCDSQVTSDQLVGLTLLQQHKRLPVAHHQIKSPLCLLSIVREQAGVSFRTTVHLACAASSFLQKTQHIEVKLIDKRVHVARRISSKMLHWQSHVLVDFGDLLNITQNFGKISELLIRKPLVLNQRQSSVEAIVRRLHIFDEFGIPRP